MEVKEFAEKNARLMLKSAALIRENESLKRQIKKLTAPKWWQFWK